MLKMVGSSICSKTGLKIKGKYGTYIVKENIGKGGNGIVYVAELYDGGEELLYKGNYAIKFLEVSSKYVHEKKKRVQRFIKEIKTVRSFQDSIGGIIPIYDASIFLEEKQENIWYLMPKAERYNIKNFSVKEKLVHMIQVGNCIKQLHERGFAHRDIKPKNLLVFENHLCLSDFGLVWNIEDAVGTITEVNDRLGPQNIRPPEMQMIEAVNGVDYRKSDVYLFAKTIWMVLNDDYNKGFSGEYSRSHSAAYINKDDFKLETAEPLHCLMEQCAIDNYLDRIDVEKCINYLKEQVGVICGDIPLSALNKWKYIEQVKHDNLSIPSDERIYREPLSMLQIINNMVGTVGLVFTEADKEYSMLPLRKANLIEKNLFEFEVLNPYYYGRKRIIELSLDYICLKKDLSYFIKSSGYTFNESNVPIFEQLLKALEAPDKHVCLSASYFIKMIVKEG
jgi:non-specific serine/threonine protein kinase